MSVNSKVFSDLQSINPSAIIELFTLQLSTALHGANTIYRFHAGSNLNLNNKITWAGNEYLRFPIQASGFAFQRGQLPRPKIIISNATGLVSSILLSVNETTTGNDLTGATVTRIRTLAKFIDAVNFPPTSVASGTTTETVADPGDAETVTYTVTVVTDNNGDNVYSVNGQQRPVITMKRGSTYIFDQSDSSNSGHPLRITSDSAGVQSVTAAGTPGSSGAKVTYAPAYPSAPSDLRYYCSTHGNAMGNTITMTNPSTITQTVTAYTNQYENPFGTPDPTAEFPQEIYSIDRKSTETREIVEFELAAPTDLAGVRIPKRQCTRSIFPSIGTFVQ
tara:strand:- start:610 stop:1611 length:1002 start_codon:yes stop_codon:yes gene_type:complete